MRLFIISIIRMWNDLQGGKIMRRQVRDERGRLINKVFRVEKITSSSEYCKIATVIDEETMMKCTLKIIAKNERTCKQQIVEEIKNQKKMSLKPHFISLKSVYEDSNSIYLLMQHWGTPLQSIMQRRKALTQQEVQLIFCQLVDMLQCLRSANVSHGNINLQSVLLSEEKPNHIQLTDFTHSYDLGEFQQTKNSTFKFSASTQYQSKAKWCLQNTISNDDIEDESNSLLKGSKQINDYTSPEEYYDDRNLTKVSYSRDIWSCGVLIYKLLTGIYPFSNESGKLIINKIKNATFSFPTLEEAKCALEDDLSSIIKKKNGLELISIEWKQLLKRMLSLKDQRITLNELIEHQFKKHYFELKRIDNIRCSLPDLKCLFSVKPKKEKSMFQKAWDINFEQKQQQIILSELLQVQSIHYTDESLKRKEDSQYPPVKIPQQIFYKNEEQSLRASLYIQKSKESDKKLQEQKHTRQHKTQFGFIEQSFKSIIEHQRHQTATGVRQKGRKQKQLSIFTPTIKKTQTNQMPQIVRQPPFILKFKFLKKSNCLTYILNNAVGVVYENGDHLIGHTKNQYRYIQQDSSKESTQLLIDNQQVINNPKRIKQSFRRGFRNIANLKNSIGEIKMTGKNKTNFTSEQNSSTNFDHVIPKYTTSNLIDGFEKKQVLCRQKYSLYVKALDRFGERVVKGELNIWIDKFWKDGNIFVFLLNNGCWQVAFLEFRGFRIYAVDQYNISWTNCESSSDILQCVRNQIKKYEGQAKSSK